MWKKEDVTTAVELSKSEVITLKVNIFLMYFSVIFILAQSFLPTPLSVLSGGDYVSFGIAAVLLKKYTNVMRAYGASKEMTAPQSRYICRLSFGGLIFLTLEGMFLTNYHPIAIVVSLCLLLVYAYCNFRVFRSIHIRFLDKYAKRSVENPAS